MHLEVEQKFRVEDPAGLEQRLNRLGIQLAAPIRQVDEYFRHPCRDFAQTDEALRIRRVGELNFVTYKGPKLDAVTKTRRELELSIAAGVAGYQQFCELLAALGFAPVAKVEKQRRIGRYMVDGFSGEVALDDVIGVGAYVEIELSAQESNLEPSRQALAKLASVLGLSSVERRSYLELLLKSG